MKSYVITDEKLSSVEWIRKNLPSDRLFFTDPDRNMLKYYGESKVVKASAEFFFSDEVAEKEINKYKESLKSPGSGKMYQNMPKLYIYYSKPSDLNPYIDRPYNKGKKTNRNDYVFDKYPDKFQRIYADKINNIFIWQIL